MAPEKTLVPVVAYTPLHRIEGMLTLLKGERLSDRLNVGERVFECLTDARVFALESGLPLHDTPSLAVNKSHITLMLPADEDRK